MTYSIRYIKKNNGFTLVELMLVIVIAGIIITTAFNLFISGFSFFTKNEEKQEIQSQMRFITNYIDENLKYNEQISIHGETDTLDPNKKTIGLNGNKIIIEDSSGSSRNLSDIEIKKIIFESFEDSYVLSLDIEHIDGYQINTNVLMNNYKAATNTTGSYIQFKE